MSIAPLLRAMYDAHASGESYQLLAHRLIAAEEQGVVARRDQTDPGNTFTAARSDPGRLHQVAKSFFVKRRYRPDPPSDEALARYLAGEDPRDVFDADTRANIGKVELVRTGHDSRRLNSDILGRATVIHGVAATSSDDWDEKGSFDVDTAPWPWPLDDDGEPLMRFGIDDQTCREVVVRLLTELREKNMFSTGHDAANRAAVAAVPTDALDLVGIAVHGPKNAVDKSLKGSRLHG